MRAPRNPNYAATIVGLSSFVDLPNCDNVKAALIFGNSVIVAKSAQAGDLGVFFPVETQLSTEFLSNNNLYRKPEFGNADPKAKGGFFEQSGRVKAMKFRGHKSEGFWIPLDSLNYIPERHAIVHGEPFDHIGDHEICRKYIPRGNRSAGQGQTKQTKAARLEDSIVEGQFRLHYDTENLRRNVHKIKPDDIISITDKWHGTSVVIGNVLVKRQLNLFERLLKRVGVAVQEDTYGIVYSSRRVIKAVNGVDKSNANHFYSTDVWGDVARRVADRIPKGFTVYGEIVGFTADGSRIQGDYTYGCAPRTNILAVYRVTLTTADGKTVELTWPQVEEFCVKYGFEVVPVLFYGRASSFVDPNLFDRGTYEWNHELLATLERIFVCDGNCIFNAPGTPAEGVVVRVDRLEQAEAFKLKNFRFLEQESKQLDKGELDIETAQSEAEEEVAA